MNIERMKIVRDAIASGSTGLGFCMTDVFQKNECGSAACIAGHTVWIFDRKMFGINRAATLLNLTKKQKNELFFAFHSAKDMDQITRDDAIRALDRVISGMPLEQWWTGEV